MVLQCFSGAEEDCCRIDLTLDSDFSLLSTAYYIS
jgi:hypothetical protein